MDMQPSELAPYIYSVSDINLITLKKGVIYTALPSKTAICLSVQRPIIACVDSDSEYAKMLKTYGVAEISESGDEKALADKILYLKSDKRKTDIMSFKCEKCFKEVFSKEINLEKI